MSQIKHGSQGIDQTNTAPPTRPAEIFSSDTLWKTKLMRPNSTPEVIVKRMSPEGEGDSQT
jgi:hypothetical protein